MMEHFENMFNGDGSLKKGKFKACSFEDHLANRKMKDSEH
jgi:hypothetical protein